MLAYAVQRTLLLIPTFIGITFVAFLIMHLAPGDPVDLFISGGLGAAGEGISVEKLADMEQAKAELRARYGLDRPWPIQYAVWFGRLVQGDMGRSLKDQRPVWDKIRERMPVTIILNVLAIVITYLIAIPLGIYSSVRPNSPFDQMQTVAVFLLYSLPVFWIGTLIIIFVCGGDFLSLFPPAGLRSIEVDSSWPLWRQASDYLYHLAMPLVCAVYGAFAALSRFMRSSMLETATMEYVRTARAKGLPERVVVLKHMLRNSLIPIVTILAGLLPALIGGSVIIETIFSLPGIGYLGYQAVLARDYPVVLGLLAAGSFLTLLGILVSDLALALIDPRISFARTRA